MGLENFSKNVHILRRFLEKIILKYILFKMILEKLFIFNIKKT